MRRRLVGALAAALLIAGCGGDEEETETGLASAVPADSVVFAEAVVRPEGEARTAIETPLAALLDTEDPGAVIVDELDRELAEEDVTYEADIEPWLGERVAVFVTSPYSTEGSGSAGDGAFEAADGGFVFETTDPDAALEFAEKFADEGDAYEIVGDHLVAGTEAAVQAASAVADSRQALADEKGYEDTVADDAADSAGHLFVDLPGVIAAAEEAGELSDSDRDALDTVFGGVADEPLAGVVEARTTGFGLDVSYGAPELPFLAAAGESALLRELPEDTWFAAGFAEAGEAIGSFLDGAEQFGVTAEELERLEREFRRDYGLELADAYAALGDGAVFASGEGIFGTGGGVVFETDDPASAERFVSGLGRAAKRGGERVRPLQGAGGAAGFALTVEGAPNAVNFVAADDRVVIAYGEDATAAALDPDAADRTLEDSERFVDAAAELGDGYAVTGYIDFAPLVELFEAVAFASPDPSLEEAMRYVESLDYLVAGSSSDGDRVHQRLFLGVADIVDPSA